MTSVLALVWAVGCNGASEPENEPWEGLPAADTDESDDPQDEGTTGDPDPDPDPDGDSTGDPEPSDEGSTGDPDPDPESDEGSTGDPEPPAGLGCDRDDLLLCDDFEDGTIDDERWQILTGAGGEVSVDPEFSYHGGGALRVSLPSADTAHGFVRTRNDTVFPVADNHFFGRAWFYLGPQVPETHSAAMGARGSLDGAVAQYRLDSNGGTFNSRYTHNPSVEQHGGLKKFGYDVPLEQWTCIEWEYDGGQSSMRYWMNGEEVTDMTVTADSEEQEWIAPTFDNFEIGWRTYQGAPQANAYDIYWDALALATFRVGCE